MIIIKAEDVQNIDLFMNNTLGAIKRIMSGIKIETAMATYYMYPSAVIINLINSTSIDESFPHIKRFCLLLHDKISYESSYVNKVSVGNYGSRFVVTTRANPKMYCERFAEYNRVICCNDSSPAVNLYTFSANSPAIIFNITSYKHERICENSNMFTEFDALQDSVSIHIDFMCAYKVVSGMYVAPTVSMLDINVAPFPRIVLRKAHNILSVFETIRGAITGKYLCKKINYSKINGRIMYSLESYYGSDLNTDNLPDIDRCGFCNVLLYEYFLLVREDNERVVACPCCSNDYMTINTFHHPRTLDEMLDTMDVHPDFKDVMKYIYTTETDNIIKLNSNGEDIIKFVEINGKKYNFTRSTTSFPYKESGIIYVQTDYKY